MKKTALLLIIMAAALVLASGVALVVPKHKARAAFPGINGKIVFTRDPDGYQGPKDPEIYTVRFDGGYLKRLTDNSTQDTSPAWSPDGARIAYSDRWDSYEPEEYVVTMSPDGSSQRYRTEGRTPDWSPDGSRIVFAGYYGAIYEMDANGTGERPLMTNQAYNANPAFSPGGGKIVFESDLDGDYDLYVMDADGTDVRQLTNLPGSEYDPDWQSVQ